MRNCLIVHQGILDNLVEYVSLMDVYKKLLSLDMAFFFKKHPVQQVTNEKHFLIFKDCIEVDRSIPAEMFIPFLGNGCIVSVYSDTLVASSFFPEVQTIALLDMVKWKNKKSKREIKDMLVERSEGRVLFPETFDELKELTEVKEVLKVED